MTNYILLVLILARFALSEDVTVTTKNGILVGIRHNITSDWAIDSFLGIPYGQPTTGLMRWNKSMPAKPWTGVRNAQKYGNICVQGISHLPELQNATQSEDCLNLNVFAPRKTDTSLVPVMVFVHGGAFINGASMLFNGTELATKGVVVVTINYRLGALGFLSTEDEASPGNYGLLDVLLALKWVQESIDVFGGDRNMVTLFGQSAGSASVSLLLTSPLAKGLFHKAICESGTGLSPWAVSYKSDLLRPLDRARLLGMKLGCTKATTHEIIDCLRTKDAIEINNVVIKNALDRLPWSPVVETIFNVVPDDPLNSWTKGNVMDIPVIRGTNSGEAAATVVQMQGNHSGISAKYYLDQLKTFIDARYFKNRDTIAKDIKMVYASPFNLSTPQNVRAALLQFISDYEFTASISWETTLDAKLGGVNKNYFYEFSYVSQNTLPVWEGAPHSYELRFVFGEPFLNRSNNIDKVNGWTDVDVAMSLTMMDLWTNFAKYGDPTPEPLYGVKWLPFTSVYNQSYFLIDSMIPTNHLNFRYEANKLWNIVIPALRREG